ncbi:MAG TPA: elongation factor P [bacterium]|jgi:elongation factor P|nr:elongation factor P [bacterium]HXC62779.1 elongation factor P [bacterium]
MATLGATEARVGTILVLEGKLAEVTEYNHIKPGKGPAKVRLKVRYLKDGRVVEYTHGINDSFEYTELDLKDMEYLYKEGEHYVFMDKENYEQIHLPGSLLGDQVHFLLENGPATVTFNGEEAVGLRLPASVTLKVTQTSEAVRGNTVNNAFKEAVLETGYSVQVPMFVAEGSLIKVDTRSGKYLERA